LLPRPDGDYFIILSATVTIEGNDEAIVAKGRLTVRVHLLENKIETRWSARKVIALRIPTRRCTHPEKFRERARWLL